MRINLQQNKFEKSYVAQWSKSLTWFFDYKPTKYKADNQQWKIRQTIWDFKKGKCPLQAGAFVGQKMLKKYGASCKDIVFACVPASTSEKNEKRYKDFSEVVCWTCGAMNGYDHIRIEQDRLAIHEASHRKKIDTVNVISIDKDFFAGKTVIIFDDIITLGYTYARFACELEKAGANVIGGMFLGRTVEEFN